ncbi:hypothetical protein [Clostridium botulinum]|uniref:hypothetical protein n=1 Tax=Clostridium botulinum TaxID=1491 RepID=UPI00131D98FB|nr:hypothetical protein [Clostridium botulinum]
MMNRYLDVYKLSGIPYGNKWIKPYKDIYQICKSKCKLLVELSYLPEQKLIA